MEIEEKSIDLIWLDEAFAKGVVDEGEASCCLAGFNEEAVKIKRDIHPSQIHWADIDNKKVSSVFRIVKSWPNLTGYMPFLWYIEQAITRNTPHVRFDLLFPKCLENEYRKKEIIANYPNLAEKLGLTMLPARSQLTKSEDKMYSKYLYENNSLEKQDDEEKNAQSQNEKNNKKDSYQDPILLTADTTPQPGKCIDSSWKENAAIIYKELRIGREHLSDEQMANKVEEEMKKKHVAGETGMTKRGGKKIPAAESIRRHVIQKL